MKSPECRAEGTHVGHSGFIFLIHGIKLAWMHNCFCFPLSCPQSKILKQVWALHEWPTLEDPHCFDLLNFSSRFSQSYHIVFFVGGELESQQADIPFLIVEMGVSLIAQHWSCMVLQASVLVDLHGDGQRFQGGVHLWPLNAIRKDKLKSEQRQDKEMGGARAKWALIYLQV